MGYKEGKLFVKYRGGFRKLDLPNYTEYVVQKNFNFIDGTYDFELIIEFWPQRLFYLGAVVSGSFFIMAIIYLVSYS